MNPLPSGIFTAVPTFFTKHEDLDLDAFRNHIAYVADAGTVPVPTGTMGEACHLSPEERCTLVRATREVLDASPKTKHMPVIAGVGAPSTRETVSLALSAADAGADFAMVIPPGYYAGALVANNMQAIKQYYVDVSEASPIPVIAYNFPAVSSGIDMDSSTVIDIVKLSPNICGMKFTCANVAKITKITATFADVEFQRAYPRRFHTDSSHEGAMPYFSAIDGFIDILLPSMSARATGSITAISNFIPRCCVKLWTLCEQSSTSLENLRAAEKLQALVSLADGEVQKVGVSGMKAILHEKFGFGILPRRPLLPMSMEAARAVLDNSHLKQLMAYEEELAEAT